MGSTSYAEVTIKSGYLHQHKAGSVLLSNDFPLLPGVTWYWVVIPEVNPSVGFWYTQESFDIVTDHLPVLDESTAKNCRIDKDGKTAYFKIDRNMIDLLRRIGWTVALDDRKS